MFEKRKKGLRREIYSNSNQQPIFSLFSLYCSNSKTKSLQLKRVEGQQFLEEGEKMENLLHTDENDDLGHQASPSSVDQNDHSTTETAGYSPLSEDSLGYYRTSSEVSGFSEPTDESIYSNEHSPALWSVIKSVNNHNLSRLGLKQQIKHVIVDHKVDDHEATESEIALMREKFAKLLLGEDMSGSGKGVCPAVTISNAITNLYATVFGQNLRLEPLRPEKKSMWKREMNCLLSVCEYIVEFIPTSQKLPDGITVEVMTSRPRSDIYINLPALQKLDAMLIEILETFQETEFWYEEQGNMSISSSTRAGSFRKVPQRKDEKWWLPVPCVPPGGLSEKSRKHLRHKRGCANQIHKAAMAINTSILLEMEIPDSYVVTLPKSGRSCLGDAIYKQMVNPEKFSPDHLLHSLNLSSEHKALELADRVEASMYTWRRKSCLSHSKSSWKMVKELMSENDKSDKNYMLAERAESLLFGLKQQYPELSQTSLDICKIQFNKDVGQAVLESYSRVLEGLAFNIVSWTEDAIYVDRSAKNQADK